MENIKQSFKEKVLIYANAREAEIEGITEREKKIQQAISNQATKEINELCKDAFNQGLLNEIEEFMRDKNPFVRFVAATHCLLINPTEAEKTLNELIALPNPNYLRPDARLSIEIWKKGLMKY